MVTQKLQGMPFAIQHDSHYNCRLLANWEKKRKDNEAKFVEATKNELDRIVGSWSILISLGNSHIWCRPLKGWKSSLTSLGKCKRVGPVVSPHWRFTQGQYICAIPAGICDYMRRNTQDHGIPTWWTATAPRQIVNLLILPPLTRRSLGTRSKEK